MNPETEEIEWLLGIFSRMLQLCTKNTLEQHNLGGVSNPGILFSLKKYFPDMTASQKDIADHLGIKPPTVAMSLKRMENAGVVCKIGDNSDQRRNLITLTDKGLEWITQSKALVLEMEQKILAGFTEADKENLTNYLLQMISNMEKMGIQPPERLKRNYQHD